MAEAEGQEQVQPGEGDVVETAPEPQATDYSSIKVEAEGLPPGLTVDGLIKSYKEARNQFSTTSSEFDKYKQQYSWAQDFEQALQQDPELERHIRSYYEDKPTPQAVNTAINPLAQDVAALKVHIRSMEMNKQLDEIARQFPMSDEIRTKVYGEAFNTGNPDVAAIYWKHMGPAIAAQSAKSASQQTAEKIAKNNSAYPKNRGTPSAPSPIDSSQLTGKAWDDAVMSAIAEEFSRTE